MQTLPASKPNERFSEEIRPVLYRLGTTKEGTLRNFAFASKLLDAHDPKTLTQAQLDGIRESILKSRKRSGARTVLVNLRTILRRVYGRHDLILKAPTASPGPKDVFEVSELQGLLDASREDPLLYAVLQTQYGATLRPGEVRALNVEDVDLQRREVRVMDAKRGSGIVNLSPQACDAIEAYMRVRQPYRDAKGNALFVATRGGGKATGGHRLGRDFISYRLKVLAARLGINHRAYAHMVRASGITHLLNVGTNPETVRKQARHGSIKTTWIYNRPTLADDRRNMDSAWERIGTRKMLTTEQTAKELLEAYRRGELSLGEVKTLLVAQDLELGIGGNKRPADVVGYS